jgi:hypothetical protein
LSLKGLNNVPDLFLNAPAASLPWLFWDFGKVHGIQDNNSLTAGTSSSFNKKENRFFMKPFVLKKA